MTIATVISIGSKPVYLKTCEIGEVNALKSPKPPLLIGLDPAWPASKIASHLLDRVRARYSDEFGKEAGELLIDGGQSEMEKVWRDLRDLFSKEEQKRLDDISHLSLPMGNLSASINMPPSRQGHFIIFDTALDLRLAEMFTAPRNGAAWAACYLGAAFDNTFDTGSWAEPAISKLEKIKHGPYPDSYSLQSARHFIYAHEWGHFFLDHLSSGKYSERNFGGTQLLVFEPAPKEELDADEFARDFLCRSNSVSGGLHMQQMGVDWLFGFLGTVLAMRKRADARRKGYPDTPIRFRSIDERRARAWSDYERRRELSKSDGDRRADNTQAVERVRASVNSFNEVLASDLADIYAAHPGEAMEWRSRVIASGAANDEESLDELMRLAAKPASLPSIGGWQRLSYWFQKLF